MDNRQKSRTRRVFCDAGDLVAEAVDVVHTIRGFVEEGAGREAVLDELRRTEARGG